MKENLPDGINNSTKVKKKKSHFSVPSGVLAFLILANLVIDRSPNLIEPFSANELTDMGKVMLVEEDSKRRFQTSEHNAFIGGTIIYVDPENNRFAAIGHASGASIQEDSNTVFALQEVEPTTNGMKSYKNYPVGETIAKSFAGVFGEFDSIAANNEPLVEFGLAVEGPAKLLLHEIWYDIEITKIDHASGEHSNIEFTMINTTAKPIPGNSGSPIIQDGKLVGAVSSCLNDPDGNRINNYAISAVTVRTQERELLDGQSQKKSLRQYYSQNKKEIHFNISGICFAVNALLFWLSLSRQKKNSKSRFVNEGMQFDM